MSYVIFSIDHENNPFRMNVFMNYLAEEQKAGRIKGEPQQTYGVYKGRAERSFILGLDDYRRSISGSHFMREQETILHIASGNKMEVSLEYLSNGRLEALGSMHQVCEAEAMQADAYTYRPDMNVWWIAKPGNPDDSYARSLREFDPAHREPGFKSSRALEAAE